MKYCMRMIKPLFWRIFVLPAKTLKETVFKKSGLALSLACCATAFGADPRESAKSMTRICMTEYDGYYKGPAENFAKRFACYKELGVDTIRIDANGLDCDGLVAALKSSSFRIKLILYCMGYNTNYALKYPTDQMIDENGVSSRSLGPWNREFKETTIGVARSILEKVLALGLAGRLDEVVVDLGPAGEPIYPANWTLGREGEEAFWFYSPLARADFCAAMKQKYKKIGIANRAWGLASEKAFANWESVAIPKPKTDWAMGEFWNDVLTWYRDSKRRMTGDRIEQTQSLVKELLPSGVKCVVYLPGSNISDEAWKQAVAEASGSASVRLMVDNDWLMETASRMKCVLQYTSVEENRVVHEIVYKLHSVGNESYRSMWGENVGAERVGRNPAWLADVILDNGIRGVDFTWSKWMFNEDGVTPNSTFSEFARCSQMIRTFYATGERLPDMPVNELISESSPGVWQLSCLADAQITANVPNETRSWDVGENTASAGDTNQNILLRFPLQLLPQMNGIRKARLILRRTQDRDDQETARLGVYRIVENWKELAATWNDASPEKPWDQAGGTAVGSDQNPPGGALASVPFAVAIVSPSKANGEAVEWDITDLVRLLITQSDQGMVIKVLDKKNVSRNFASRKNQDKTLRPLLVIER
jgi:hypothetical protein